MNVVCQSSLGDAALLGLISSSFFLLEEARDLL